MPTLHAEDVGMHQEALGCEYNDKSLLKDVREKG